MVCLESYNFITHCICFLVLSCYINLGVPQKKNVRGQIICKEIHARTLDERDVVKFDLRKAVGPTDKAISNLSNFIGTIARNPRFITLCILVGMLFQMKLKNACGIMSM